MQALLHPPFFPKYSKISKCISKKCAFKITINFNALTFNVKKETGSGVVFCCFFFQIEMKNFSFVYFSCNIIFFAQTCHFDLKKNHVFFLFTWLKESYDVLSSLCIFRHHHRHRWRSHFNLLLWNHWTKLNQTW